MNTYFRPRFINHLSTTNMFEQTLVVANVWKEVHNHRSFFPLREGDLFEIPTDFCLLDEQNYLLCEDDNGDKYAIKIQNDVIQLPITPLRLSRDYKYWIWHYIRGGVDNPQFGNFYLGLLGGEENMMDEAEIYSETGSLFTLPRDNWYRGDLAEAILHLPICFKKEEVSSNDGFENFNKLFKLQEGITCEADLKKLPVAEQNEICLTYIELRSMFEEYMTGQGYSKIMSPRQFHMQLASKFPIKIKVDRMIRGKRARGYIYPYVSEQSFAKTP